MRPRAQGKRQELLRLVISRHPNQAMRSEQLNALHKLGHLPRKSKKFRLRRLYAMRVARKATIKGHASALRHPRQPVYTRWAQTQEGMIPPPMRRKRQTILSTAKNMKEKKTSDLPKLTPPVMMT